MSGLDIEMAEERHAAWLEWKRICDWSKCDDSTQGLLGAFVFARLKSAIYASTANEREWSPVRFEDFFLTQGEDCNSKNLEIAFLTFEGHLLGIRRKDEKKPKDWLFEQGSLKCVEGRVTCGLKTEIVRAITGTKRRVSRISTFDTQSHPEAEEGISVPKELVDKFFHKGAPSENDVEIYEQAAAVVGRQLFEASSLCARVAYVAKHCKVSTADLRVNEAAGAQKTKLSKEYRDFMLSIGDAIEAEEFAPEELSEKRYFARLVLSVIDVEMIEWAKSAEKMEWAASIIIKKEDENAKKIT
ncbi:hypothetical protein ACWPKO_17240 [Coraliomargarita sp. W4R53]